MITARLTQQYLARTSLTLMLLLLIMSNLVLTGCASWQVPPEFDVSTLRSRAVTAEVKGVRLNAAVLSAADNQHMFGVDINKKEVQPVWIEVENTTNQALWLLRPGTDPDIFSPLEVAWSFHTAFSSENNARIDDHFDALAFQSPIAPHSKQAGIIYTNPHREVRLLNVDLLGQGQFFPFTLFLPIPDDSQSKRTQAAIKRFIEQKTKNYLDEASFRARLEQIPCCAKSSDGTESGDPLNLVIVGQFKDISAAVVRRGFREKNFDFDNKQHLFGRSPDAVIRKAGQGGVPAYWIRLWIAPFRYEGNAVFLAQVGRPVGGRFSANNEKDIPQILHPNVDEVRNILLGDMLYSGGLGKIAFVTGVGKAGKDQPRASLDGASYFTDGIRSVMFFVTRPRTMSQVEILNWYPFFKLREEQAASKSNKGQN